MTDWRRIINEAIAERTIANFVTYRAERGLEARGWSLKNPPAQLELDAIVEDFLLDDRFTDLGVMEVRRLCDRLASALNPDEPDPEKLRLMNLCFDALVCIRELETRVTRQRR